MPPPEMYNEGGDEVFEIDKIVGRKDRGQRIYYLVKWVGYSSRRNTWEPKENLIEDGQGRLLEEYDNSIATLLSLKTRTNQVRHQIMLHGTES